MRKDYVAARGTPKDETAFVESYWTKVWQGIGERAKRPSNVETTEEYRAMAPYLGRLSAGARIVDGGCGLGEFVVHLSGKGFRATGIDLSRETIAELKARHPGIDFVDGDIRALAMESDTVDAYYSWGVFEHFESGPGDCIREAYRILKPGGTLFVSVPFDNLRHAVRATFERPREVVGPHRFYQWRFTRAELARELSLGGFQVEHMRPISKAEGVLRLLRYDLGLPFGWIGTRALRRVLTPVLPRGLVAHMLLAVAKKPGEAPGHPTPAGRSAEC